MGAVYLGRRPELDRPVAIKLILSHLASETTLQRFLREANSLAKIQHPNVIQIFELGQSPHGPFLIQEYVDGTPLDELVRDPPAPERIAEIGAGIASALTALHERGLVHRDLKPSNVLLRPDGSPVLLDFGLARAVEDERLTLTGEVLGTPGYMSPEQADGASIVPATDVYGLGALLFALLAGRAPFAGLGPIQFLAKVLSDQDPRWPSADRPETPVGLEAIVRLAMAKAPEARYPSVAAMQDDLERWLAGETPLAAGGAHRTKRALIGLAPLILVVLLVAMLAAAGVRVARELSSTSAVPTPSATLPPPSPALAHPPPPAKQAAQDLAALAPLLEDRTRWNQATPLAQDRLVKLIADKLSPAFSYVTTERFSAGGPTHRIAVFRHERTRIELCLLPGGTFLQARGTPKRPTRVTVTVPPLLIGRYEVSKAEFLAGTRDASGYLKGPTLHLPHRLNWNAATLWVDAVGDGLRLPSEAEWEYAARAGTTTQFFWGEAWEPLGPKHAICKLPRKRGVIRPSNAEGRLPNAFGLVDVLGNVMELCSDTWARRLNDHPTDGSPFLGGSTQRCVRRGGTALREFQSSRITGRSNRLRSDPKPTESGIRVARSLPELRG